MEEKDILAEVKLRYVTDNKPGFTRKLQGKHFAYFDRKGERITDDTVIERINKIVIPPAWKRVWISPYANGHMQATGIDARGRKQYRYHQFWNELKQQEKFSHVLDFASALPRIRRHINESLELKGLPKEKVMATVIWLLEHTLIRVGNIEYKEENNSYGLTTLTNRHVHIKSSNIDFSFVGKSGVKHKVHVSDKKIANIIRRCQELPGQDLFEYIDDDGKPNDVTSHDINEYLKAITGKDITAKDFRTWGGTVAAASLLDKAGISDEEKSAEKTITETVKRVAEHLRNKPATCRKYYIHPTIFEAYTNGYVISNLKDKLKEDDLRKISGLNTSENEVVVLLKVMMREGEKNLDAKAKV